MVQDVAVCTKGYLRVYFSGGRSAAAFPQSGAVWSDAANASTREHLGAWSAKESLQESVLFFFFFTAIKNSLPSLHFSKSASWRSQQRAVGEASGAKPVCEGRRCPCAGFGRGCRRGWVPQTCRSCAGSGKAATAPELSLIVTSEIILRSHPSPLLSFQGSLCLLQPLFFP